MILYYLSRVNEINNETFTRSNQPNEKAERRAGFGWTDTLASTHVSNDRSVFISADIYLLLSLSNAF